MILIIYVDDILLAISDRNSIVVRKEILCYQFVIKNIEHINYFISNEVSHRANALMLS